MHHHAAILVILFAMVLAWVVCAAALEFNTGVALSTVNLATINQEIQLYADEHHESIGGIHSVWSLGIGITPRLSILGIEPCLFGQSFFASSGSGGGPIKATALGLAAGGRYAIGPWSAYTDLGIYRGTFSFPRAAYDLLSGWGFGINGAIEYTLHLTKRISVAMSLTLRWLSIGQMSDRLGTPYVGRGGPFFDMSGVGVGIDLIWIAW